MSDKTDSYDVTAEADQAHDDKWLADQVVALGVAYSNPGGSYTLMGHGYGLMPREFVRDPRVAMALMEKCSMIFIENTPGTWACRADASYGNRTREWYHNESQPRAITEACVEALT